MHGLHPLIVDLMLITVYAAITTLVFKKLKQPMVLGYLLAGIFAGPFFNLVPTVTDRENLNLWADIGVIFLLFSLGLEFSFKKMVSVGKSAIITATLNIFLLLFIGYYTAMFIGWSLKKSDNLTQLDKKLRSFSSEEIEAIKEIAYDTAIEDEDYIGITYDIMPDTHISYEEIDEIKPIIQKTIVKINRNPQLLEDTVKFLNQRTLNSEKIRKYHKILRNELKSLGIFEENEIGNVGDRIARNFENNVDKILLENISNEFVKADIDKFLKI